MSDEIKPAGPGRVYWGPVNTPPPTVRIAHTEVHDRVMYWCIPRDDGGWERQPIMRMPSEEEMAAASEALRASFLHLGEQLTEVWTQLRPRIDAMREAFVEAGRIAEQPPTDPRERALWLRQHRNTGPARPGPQKRRRTDQ